MEEISEEGRLFMAYLRSNDAKDEVGFVDSGCSNPMTGKDLFEHLGKE